MSNLPEQNEECNGTTEQNDPTPINSENLARTAPDETIAIDVVEGAGDNAPPDAAEAQPTPPPQLFAVIDGVRQAVEFSELTDGARRLLLQQRCEAAEQPVTIQATELFVLDAGRSIFCCSSSSRNLGNHVYMQIGEDRERILPMSSSRSGGFSHGAYAEAQSIRHCERLWRLRHCSSWTKIVAPRRRNTVADALTRIGAAPNVDALAIFRTIRTVAGIDPNKPGLDDLASGFHGCLPNRRCGRRPVNRRLRYFRDDFYTWNGRTWQRVDDKEFKAIALPSTFRQRSTSPAV